MHANFIEYVPLALILLGLAKSLGAAHLLLHIFGLMLLIGRLSHTYGVFQPNETFAFRITGTVLTFDMPSLSAITCLVESVWRLT